MSLFSLAAMFAGGGCEPGGTAGLHPAEIAGQPVGPRVVFDPLRRPDPEVPFPSDLAIRLDPGGVSSLNVSEDAHTAYERRFRRHLNGIPGFSGMTPISLSFESPLDLSTVRDDTVFVINVTPGSKRYGERLPLDLGRGWFPPNINPTWYLPHDPFRQHDSMILPPGNAVDTDGDGLPDAPVYHYEIATHTLDLRPLVPMEAATHYAVVLTREVKGWAPDGTYGSIRSPFEGVNHDSQTRDLTLALPSLAEAGVGVSDIAFAWTLSTGDLARTFRTLRDGLYGRGPFAWLAEQFPPGISDVYDLHIEHDGDASHPNPAYQFPYVERDHTFILQGAFLNGVIDIIGAFQSGIGVSFDHVDYAVFGEYLTPSFRAAEHEVWDVNLEAGTATVAPERVPWMLTVPKATLGHQPPFPVLIHAHATATSRIEALLLADKMAHAGIATFCIDAVGHGPILTDPKRILLDELGGGGDPAAAESLVVLLVRGLIAPLLYPDWEERVPSDIGLDDLIALLLDNGFMAQLAKIGRAVDDDGDCRIEGGEAYYTPDPFRLRDAMRQTTLDYMVAVRMLHSLRPDAVPAAIADPRSASAEALRPNLLAGDFNADGVLDVGGPDVPYFMSGVSLGGIHTALTAPLEEYIVAAAPVVAGAGLADIFVRTRLRNVVKPIMHLASGPAVIGCPQEDGVVALSFNDDSDDCRRTEQSTWQAEDGTCLELPEVRSIVQAELKIPGGARVRATHLPSGHTAEAEAHADGGFAVAIGADKGDPILLEVLGEGGTVLSQAELVSPYTGVAESRNTPEFRRLVQRVANVLEGSDAITVADRVLLDPLEGYPATHTLLMLASGDRTVNFASGVALARAMGLYGRGDQTADDAPYRAWSEGAIEGGHLVQHDLTPPLLDPSLPEGGPGYCTRLDTVPGQPGQSALCLADVAGHHEYIAQARNTDAFPGPEGFAGTYTEYHQNMMVSFFHSLGTRVVEDPCWADWKCVLDRGLHEQWEQPIGAR